MSEASLDLSNFRSPGGPNSRLAHWEPREPTLRWFRSYLQVCAESTPVAEREILKQLPTMSLGNPVTVTVLWNESYSPVEVEYENFEAVTSPQGMQINLDYLYAAEEVNFVLETLIERKPIQGIRHVIELGAGFGRTAHTMLSVCPSIERYEIIDLPETLALSRMYLEKVLPEALLGKVEFVDAGDVDELQWPTDGNSTPDLAIQIDGLQEMEKATIDFYYQTIFDNVKYVFLSNPVGKYLPEVAGIDADVSRGIEHVMNLGRCNSLIDPWNSIDLRLAQPQYLELYQPEGHKVLQASSSRIRPLYQHVLYEEA